MLSLEALIQRRNLRLQLLDTYFSNMYKPRAAAKEKSTKEPKQKIKKSKPQDLSKVFDGMTAEQILISLQKIGAL